jgi:hypothetical protein
MMTPAGIYNARNPEMRVLSPCARCVLCALLLLARLACASDWRSPESQLTAKIASITGPGVIALELNNRSSITPSEVEKIRRDLPVLLQASGVRVGASDQATSSITVTLSENLQNYVWIAEIHQGINQPSIVMISTPRPDSASIPQNAPPLTLRATPLISQPDPILDVAIIAGDPRKLLALSASVITPYEFRSNRWIRTADQPVSIISQHPLPRDLRGRIVLRSNADFSAYLPGLICRNTSSTLAVNCSDSDDPWPLKPDFSAFAFFAPSRNFFTGALVPGIGQQKSAPAFYSAAAIPRPKYTLWILAGIDGQLHLLDGINHQTLPKIRWGDDIASLHAPCRTDWQVLATSVPGGFTNGAGGFTNNDKDSVQAFEFPDREPVPVSQKLELNGSVTALWTSQTGDSATAVFRNSDTGNYEAVMLDLTCGQ